MQMELEKSLSPDHDLILAQAASLFSPDIYPLSSCSNLTAFLWSVLPRINWVGFYLLDGDALHLGPFQGKVACTDIRLGQGVCGTAALEKRTLIVEDVHAFPGHIACDGASRSEIVIPLMKNGQVLGVLDIDSPELNRFSPTDGQLLEKICELIAGAFSGEKKLL